MDLQFDDMHKKTENKTPTTKSQCKLKRQTGKAIKYFVCKNSQCCNICNNSLVELAKNFIFILFILVVCLCLRHIDASLQ